ncbi:hypothetical protein PMAC_001848 [Pneumocystis sp. 'macacae']|nr:hypothetical protein PMAC_001848 [Pneumocystis sp. 'macacae']
MTNPRQHKKQKKAIIKKKALKRHKPLFIKSDPIISENWNKKKTLKQNYSHLGLIAKPNDKNCIFIKKHNIKTSFLNKNDQSKLQPNEARIQRDNEGNIVKIIYGKQREFDDILNSDIKTEEISPKTKKKATRSTKIDRKLSKNETLFLRRLIDCYGDNIDAMTKDIKLNAMQLTAGDLQRKIKKLNKNREINST